MHIDLSDDQKALQIELRQYFSDLMTDEVKERIRSAEFEENLEYKALIRQVGADGWLGVGWPAEYGGKGFTPIEQYIFFNESQAAACPIPFLTTNTVGPTLRNFGTDDQKSFFLPKILAGDMHFSIGYSEPEAGTDLASLKTKAVRDGDEWVITGQKLYTSLAYNADYIWLAARTDPDARAHKGITMFLVPTDSEGFSIQPFETFGQTDTTATFYDEVRVPDSAVVGELHGGWNLITSQLNHERVSLCASGRLLQLVDQAVRWARDTSLADGRRVIDQEWVQVKLAEIKALVDYLDLLNWKVAFDNTHGRMNPADASSVKVHGSESMHRIYLLLTEILGAAAHLRGADTLAGQVEASYRSVWVLTFGGGTNEIQRDIIGMAGLGLPESNDGDEAGPMDFSLNETQQAVFDLASQIMGDKVDMERLREVEAGAHWFDRETYAELAKAGLVGLALAEDVGGGGQDLVAWGQVLRAQGTHVAPVPLLPTTLGALAIDQHGDPEQRARLLPGVVDGSRILTVAGQEPFAEDVRAPGCSVVDGMLHGTKIVVEYADVADQMVVTAVGDQGEAQLYLVDTDAVGITRHRSVSSRLEPLHQLDFDATPTQPLGGAGAVDWLVDRHLAGLCATQVGVSETALALTAEYTSTREQFGRPIATFQAVTQRLGDQYINVNGIALTASACLWRLANGVDDRDGLLVAKWWASERAQDVVHATQHCHGGMGVSIDYPLFRYSLWSKHLTVSLGAGTQQLRALGARMAT